jgi:hypothetical protein
MDARTGYTDRMTERGAQAQGGAHVRAVAYVRVSSEEQRHGYSLDDQERELCIQIELKGWELVEVVRDEGLSGADPSRPGPRRIEELARESRPDRPRGRWCHHARGPEGKGEAPGRGRESRQVPGSVRCFGPNGGRAPGRDVGGELEVWGSGVA